MLQNNKVLKGSALLAFCGIMYKSVEIVFNNVNTNKTRRVCFENCTMLIYNSIQNKDKSHRSTKQSQNYFINRNHKDHFKLMKVIYWVNSLLFQRDQLLLSAETTKLMVTVMIFKYKLSYKTF